MIAVSTRKPAAATAARRQSAVRPRNTADVIQRVVSTLQLATAPSRMRILMLLAERERFAGEIRDALGNPSQPAVSHQLSLLRHGRLIESWRDGRRIVYRLTDAGRLLMGALERLGA